MPPNPRPLLEIPPSGDARQLWLAELHQAIAADARTTRAALLWRGWDAGDAADAYREWLHGLLDAAAAEGWRTL